MIWTPVCASPTASVNTTKRKLPVIHISLAPMTPKDEVFGKADVLGNLWKSRDENARAHRVEKADSGEGHDHNDASGLGYCQVAGGYFCVGSIFAL
ncbi:hypothetical protein HG530_010976 [Fusarium avenaceum]|nr:hypothetical protein HG530_010976 [Fusarium avenaceum]